MATNEQEAETDGAWMVADAGGLTTQARWEANALAATVTGRVEGANALAFQDALAGLIDKDAAAVVLDLEQLSYISSAGLRVILLAAQRLQERNVKFMVCSLSDSVSEVFQVSGFDKIVPIYATRPDALSAARE